jgi:uncharacterized membrane protein YczE
VISAPSRSQLRGIEPWFFLPNSASITNQLTIGQFKLILIFLLIVCFLNHAYIPNNVIESIKEMDKNQNSKGYVMDV